MEIYPGSPFGTDWRMISDPGLFILAGLFLIIPAGFFALFAVWPVVLLSIPVVRHIQVHIKVKQDWPLWIVAGAMLGPFLLFAYSFPLGLGQTLIWNLILTGTMCGALCAILVRWLIGPEIDDGPIVIDSETTDHIT